MSHPEAELLDQADELLRTKRFIAAKGKTKDWQENLEIKEHNTQINQTSYFFLSWKLLKHFFSFNALFFFANFLLFYILLT